MKKSSLILTLCGAAVTILCLALLVIGILDTIERSKYQNLGLNYPVVIPLGLGLIVGVALVIIGIRKMKSVK